MAKTNIDNQAVRGPGPGDKPEQEPVLESGTKKAGQEARDSLNNLNHAPSVPPPTEPHDEAKKAEAQPKLEPLNEAEKLQLAELERKSKMGRPMDQPSMREMHRLGVLRKRSKIAAANVKE